MAVAAVVRCAQVLCADLFPPEKAHVRADLFETHPFFSVGAPPLAAAMTKFSWPNLPHNLRDSATPSTISFHLSTNHIL